ncbi:MAG: helix-turn-helix domain-containing protein [Actinomycetota bacterium]|nr:helix-turn-helix domain-containing protein [Actinomycetota bacterium]
MLILSPEELERAWRDAVSAGGPEREYKRHVLASVALQAVGAELGLHGPDNGVAFKESFDLLELSGLIGRDELRQALTEIDDQSGTARAFVASLGRLSRETAAMGWLPEAARDRAAGLAERWRVVAAQGLSGTDHARDGEVYVTVAEVAAVYDVTPQAVYKWIHKGAIEAHTRPGGSYQIPISALTSDERFDVGRSRRLQHALARRHDAQLVIAADAMVEQVRSRRAASR